MTINYPTASIIIAIIAIFLSIFRFKRELTVIGSKIEFVNIIELEIDADHSSLQENTKWHYQFELLFKNQGDRNGMMLIDKIESNLFDAIALMKGGVRHLRKFPVTKMIQSGDFLTIKFASYASAFSSTYKDEELVIHYRTWKKVKRSFKKLKHDKLYSLTAHQVLRLNKPKRRREGIIERLDNIEAQDVEK